eukprot:SAG11_NODE_9521_length_903_cov_1.538557_2_plen_174_part_00
MAVVVTPGRYPRECPQLALYPGGGTFYTVHVDNPAGLVHNPGRDNGRRLTAILYLNIGWDAVKYGGCLRIHRPLTAPPHGSHVDAIEKSALESEPRREPMPESEPELEPEPEPELELDPIFSKASVWEVEGKNGWVDVAPLANRLVLFSAKRVPHEVQETTLAFKGIQPIDNC